MISFIYGHQIHCWMEIKSKSRFQGLIMLAGVYICLPADILRNSRLWQHFICTDQDLCIQHYPNLDKLNVNIREGSEENNGMSSKQDIDVQRKQEQKGQTLILLREHPKMCLMHCPFFCH